MNHSNKDEKIWKLTENSVCVCVVHRSSSHKTKCVCGWKETFIDRTFFYFVLVGVTCLDCSFSISLGHKVFWKNDCRAIVLHNPSTASCLSPCHQWEPCLSKQLLIPFLCRTTRKFKIVESLFYNLLSQTLSLSLYRACPTSQPDLSIIRERGGERNFSNGPCARRGSIWSSLPLASEE
jgi:hypothetical protein